MAERFGHPRQQFVLRVGVRGVADHPFFLGELQVEEQRIVPLEHGLGRGVQAIGGIHGQAPA